MRLHRKSAQVLLVFILLASVAVATSASAESYVVPDLQVDLRQGAYKGLEASGVYIWRGIQYATAPRFQAPGKMPDSDNVIEAFTHGKNTWGPMSGDPDCLNLAVYVNPIDTGKPKSVFMWVFGSANMGGSPGNSDWTEFVAANPDIIVVTPNHRGGLFGSIDLRQLEGYDAYTDANGVNPYDISNNIARLDILEVLKWINENIAAFGGNPNDVSIGGQSSGSNLCLAVMLMPESAPYWHQSLNQESFPLDSSLMPLEAAQEVAQGVFTALGVDTMEAFLALTNDRVFGMSWPPPSAFGYKGLSPVIDNVVIHADYYELLLDGLWAGKQMIMGSNNGCYDQMHSDPGTSIAVARSRNAGNLGADGWHGYPVGEPGDPGYIPNFADYIVERFISHNGMYGRDLGTTGADLDNDMQMRVPAHLFAEAASLYTDVYFYHNIFSTGAGRAAHGSENTVIQRRYTSEDPGMIEAANRISDIWATFIRTGNPNFDGLGTTWTRYNAYSCQSRDTMVLARIPYMVNGVRNADIDLLMPLTREYPLLDAAKSEVTSATPTAFVKKLWRYKNELTITVTEETVCGCGQTNTYTETFTIRNNAGGIYTVGDYKVYVKTKGNDQIRECYIIETPDWHGRPPHHDQGWPGNWPWSWPFGRLHR